MKKSGAFKKLVKKIAYWKNLNRTPDGSAWEMYFRKKHPKNYLEALKAVDRETT